MHYDVINLRTFYAGRLGRQVYDVVAARLAEFWPTAKSDKHCRFTAVGYGVPYLERLWPAGDITALMPAHLGVHRWAGPGDPNGANKTALIDEPALPLADNSIDRVCWCIVLSTAAMPTFCWRRRGGSWFQGDA